MDFETTKQLVFEVLRSNFIQPDSNLQMPSIIHGVYESSVSKGILHNDPNITVYGGTKLPDENVEHVLDLMNLLLQQGIIRWGLNGSNLNPPFMSVTEYGRKVLQDNDTTPYDPDGYLDSINSKFQLDDILKPYLSECIQTFQRGNFLSSAVMLGVAAEHIFNEIYDSFIESLQSEKIKSEFEKIRDSAKTKRRIDLVEQTLTVTAKNDFPKDMVDNFSSQTSPILNLIRRLRNDVGHPNGVKIERMEMYTNMMLFRVYCEASNNLINFLKKNQIMLNKKE